MHYRLITGLLKHSKRVQPRQKLTEALLRAVEMRDKAHAPGTPQHKVWSEAVELLKNAHLRMPKY